jgi:hypothetical protein
MFCRKCYADLKAGFEGECPVCGQSFDPADPRTYLGKPFPPPSRVVWHVISTTLVGIGVAFVVAFHQMARTSGH